MTRTLPLLALWALACTSPQTPTADPPVAEPIVVQPAPFQKLTAPQLRNTLVDLLGPIPRSELPADTHPHLFRSIGAASTSTTERGVDQIEVAVHLATDSIFFDPARRVQLVGCEPTSPGDACVQNFVQRFGLRAYRRPLTSDEIERWTWVATEVADGDPWRGLQHATAGMLQAPSALYRVELGEPDPDDPDRLRLTGFELAARLSYLLWETTPDQALLDAAAAGELDHPAGIEAQARRLLADPRARRATQAFFDQYLDLGKLDQATPDPQVYPEFTESLRDAMRTEVHLVVDDLVHRRNTDVRALFSGTRSFVNPELAQHYGLPQPDVSPVTFVAVDLGPQGPRAGVQSRAALLTMNAHPIETSPTRRGKFVMERILCEFVPPPPGDVDLEIAADDGQGRTLRERLEQHRTDPACAHCHAQIDPPGFLFEHFDAIGRWRDDEGGLTIDDSGELSGTTLHGTGDLGAALATDERVPACMTRQLFRHAHGRLERSGDLASLEQIEAAFAASDYRFQELLVALVTHESFRAIAPPVVEAE